MVVLQRIPTSLLAILAGLLWIAYFMLCAEPIGAPFIYAEF